MARSRTPTAFVGDERSESPKSGIRSVGSLGSCKSLAELFLRRVRATPHSLAFEYPGTAAEYSRLSWLATLERVRPLALGLHALGVTLEQPCALLSATRIEWILADLAILCAGGATTTVYPSSSVDECAFILADAACSVAFVENTLQLEKLRARKSELPELRKVVLIDGEAGRDPWVMSLEELRALGEEEDAARPGLFEKLTDAVEPSHLASLVYTSGTTGRPKGAPLPRRLALSGGGRRSPERSDP